MGQISFGYRAAAKMTAALTTALALPMENCHLKVVSILLLQKKLRIPTSRIFFSRFSLVGSEIVRLIDSGINQKTRALRVGADFQVSYCRR
jgi:hypothetical protein